MNEADLLNILAAHQGRDAGIRSCDLARLCGIPERHVRKYVGSLRRQGIAICAKPRTGYYMAVTAEELSESCAFLHQRALHSLLLASRMQRISLPDLLGQLKLVEGKA